MKNTTSTRKRLFWFAMVCLLGGSMVACTPTDPQKTDDKALEAKMKEVVTQYAAVVWATYQGVDKGLVDLQSSIDAFLKAPSQAGLEDAKKKWLAVRDIYGQTEAFRFYGGPIDDDRGLEGRLNAWPLDEIYIDYVKDSPDSGIINDATTYPTIDKKTLIALNEKDGEKNISLGFHAIEFLLWGQDLSADGPGARPHTDFLKDGGTAANQERRGQYLKIAMEILLEDFRTVMNDWKPDTADNFRDKFTKGDAKDAITKIMTGIGTLSGGELSGERLTTPYKEKDQEEEHSCFSDNTKADVVGNAMGIQNVFLGKYGSTTGTSLYDLIKDKDAKLADELKAQIDASVAASQTIPAPFDQAILGEDTSPGRVKVQATITALQTQAQSLAKAGSLLGLTINTELPD